jgi:hypothetical protein
VKLSVLALAVGAAMLVALVAYGLLARGVVQTAIDRSQACQSAYDGWVASGSPGSYTDPCTHLVYEPVPTFKLVSFAPPWSGLPGFSP